MSSSTFHFNYTIRSQRRRIHAFMTSHALIFCLMLTHFGASQNVAAATLTLLPPAMAAVRAAPSLVAANDIVQRQQENQQQQQQQHSTNENVLMMTPGQKVIAAVPLEDQNDFILYHLSIALNIVPTSNEVGSDFDDANGTDVSNEYEERFATIPVYDGFDNDLLNWVMSSFNATELNVCLFVRSKNRLCTSQGVCYTQDDIGCYCCPF